MPVPDTAEEIVRMVGDDVASAFASAFPGEFEIPEPFGDDLPIGTGRTTAVPWRWTGKHEGLFQGIPPTHLDVVVTGVTLLRDDGGEVLYHRIVDWLDLYRSVGVVTASRATLATKAAQAKEREAASD